MDDRVDWACATGGGLARAYLDAVLAAVPAAGGGVTPRQAYAVVRVGAPVTLRHALRVLVAERKVRFEGEERSRRYWRVGEAQ
jgi:hypothetical protein